MTKDEIKEIDRKMYEYVKRSVSRNGIGVQTRQMLVNYGLTIGYLEAHYERFALDGMKQNLTRKALEYSDPRDPGRYGEPMAPTSANQSDVANLEAGGFHIDLGETIRKELFHCTKKQFKETLRRDEKTIAGFNERYAYNVALYELRFGEQYKLPFHIPVDVQRRMKEQAQEDLRRSKTA